MLKKSVKDGNVVLGEFPTLNQSKIIFNGKNNILYCEKGVTITNSQVMFQGDNSVIFMSASRNSYLVHISINHNSCCYFGQNCFFNSKMSIVISEEKNVLIGDDGLFSLEIWLRTADPHIIYSVNTMKRVNHSKSIFIGDHVWLGQHASLFKGTQIGSGSIVGAMSVVTGKKIPSNVSCGGNPVKLIGKDVFFTTACVHRYRKAETAKSCSYESKEFIYEDNKKECLVFDELDQTMSSLKTSKEKFEFLSTIRDNRNKNRFYIKEGSIEGKKSKLNVFRKKLQFLTMKRG